MSNFLGEVLGTMILIILGCGVNAGGALTKTFSNAGGWLMGAVGWGLAVMIAIFAVGGISGAHINPAVTVGLAVAGEFEWAKVPTYICGQMIGAIIGATLVYFQYLPHWKETSDQATKLGVFSTSPAVKHTPANLISEIIGTAVLVLGLLAIGANSFADGLNPLIVGLLITSIGISLGGTTGYAINPARDLGPRIAHAILPIAGKGDSNWGYAWIPVVGPIAGGALGALVYTLLW
jgi:glycerol uptake facilitator protein